MKKYFLIAMAMLLMAACNNQKQEVANSNHEKDSLMAIVNERDSSLNDFISACNEVETNLDSVAARQHIITVNTETHGELLKPKQKARSNDEIAAINNLMDQNRKKIAELNRKLKGSTGKNAELEKTIATLNSQLAQKETELAELNTRLNALNVQVEQLTVKNTEQSKTIADETAALHTAYYVVGKSKELRDAKIIDRKGGLLGIGRTAKLSGDFDNSKFTRIDYTQTTTIAVNSVMKMITSHPSDSYTLEKVAKTKDVVQNIIITNPEKFWSASKYLVVVKD